MGVQRLGAAQQSYTDASGIPWHSRSPDRHMPGSPALPTSPAYPHPVNVSALIFLDECPPLAADHTNEERRLQLDVWMEMVADLLHVEPPNQLDGWN